MKKTYLVTDLGPGDGGKGGVVHRVATLRRAHTIVKVGGAQGSHGVNTSAGQRFAFSQWGCGTFEGIPTFLSKRFVVSPEGLLNEAVALRYQQGIHAPFALLTVDGAAICATPYHRIASRLKELARGRHPRGTVGTGVGEAVRAAERFPELCLRARDLAAPDLRERMNAIRQQVRRDLDPVLEAAFLPDDVSAVNDEMLRLQDDGFFEHVVHRFQEAAAQLRVVDQDFLRREILAREGVVVVESSHGVLTDALQGFHPHTSALRTLPRFTHTMLTEAGYDGQIVNLGVTRAYQIRHGAGPMPTADPAQAETLLPGSHKDENRYQGRVRVGALDLPLLRYALACCGGPTAFDGLAVTWFDQMQKNGAWQVCERYHGATDTRFFTETGELKVRHGEGVVQLLNQRLLGEQLNGCVPETVTRAIAPEATRDQLFTQVNTVLHEQLGVPVRMVGFGPTEQDKLCK